MVSEDTFVGLDNAPVQDSDQRGFDADGTDLGRRLFNGLEEGDAADGTPNLVNPGR